MPWTVYRYDDAGAPNLTGAAGSLIAILDAVLVNGYGVKPAAGWAKAFSGTNKAAYRMGAGRFQAYFRVVDDASGAAGAKEAQMHAYESMSGIDAGANVFTGTGISTSDITFRKSNTADATVRPWMILADARTCIVLLCCNYAAADFRVNGTYFGEFFSFVLNDNWAVCVIGRTADNDATTGYTPEAIANGHQATSSWTLTGHWLARDSSGINRAVGFMKFSVFQNTSGPMDGIFTFPNPADGGAILSPLYVREQSPAGTYTLRGRLRGFWASGHSGAAMANGMGLNPFESFSATGDWAGRSFAPFSAGGIPGNWYLVETSNTVDTH
jgi:hypothetical protein